MTFNNERQYKKDLVWAWGKSKTLYFTFNSWTTLWIKDYIWFWFQPSAYIIQAWLKWSIAWTSMSYYTYFDWTIWWYYQYPNFQNENTLRAINVNTASAALVTKANFSSFLSDWIALDYVNNDNTIWFTITAFK